MTARNLSRCARIVSPVTALRQHGSRIALWLAFAVFGTVWIWVAATAGDQLPARFDNSGAVMNRDSTWSFLVVIGGIGVAFTLASAVAPALISRVPAHAISLPSPAAHRYWTDPANRAEFDRKIGADIQAIVGATVLLLAWVLAVSGSTTGDAVSAGVLDAPIIAYLVGILGYCAYLARGARYRVPDPGS